MELKIESSAKVRVGECNQCGECCKRLGWLWTFASEETIEWIRARDPEIKIVEDDAAPNYFYISIPYPCKQLVDLGNGKYLCKMHDKKPRMCRDYPSIDDELKPGCGYKFADVPASD